MYKILPIRSFPKEMLEKKISIMKVSGEDCSIDMYVFTSHFLK